jgi:hypothetical protein
MFVRKIYTTLVLGLSLVIFGCILTYAHGDGYTLYGGTCAQNNAYCDSCRVTAAYQGSTNTWNCEVYACSPNANLVWSECTQLATNTPTCHQSGTASQAPPSQRCNNCYYKICQSNITEAQCANVSSGATGCNCPFTGGTLWADTGWWYPCTPNPAP